MGDSLSLDVRSRAIARGAGFNQPFTDKDGIEHYPQDFIMISEELSRGPRFSLIFPRNAKEGVQKKYEEVESIRRRNKMPSLFHDDGTQKKSRDVRKSGVIAAIENGLRKP